MSTFDDIRDRVEAAPDLDAALATLLDGLAGRIKATSNDQNIQRLARDLRAAAPNLATSVAAKRALAKAG